MSTTLIDHRLVVEYDTDGSRWKINREWVVRSERTRVVQLEGRDYRFSTVSYHGDRDFARFCGADVSKSNPMVNYTFSDALMNIRNKASNEALNAIACEKLLGHTPGAPINVVGALAEFMPATIKIHCPAIGDVEAVPIDVIPEVSQPKNPLQLRPRPRLSVTFSEQ
jgi:hypothetical protein